MAGEAKFTPAPWFRTWTNRITRSPDSGGQDSICHVYDSSIPGEYEANMALIAAAPDLLEALQEISRQYENQNISHVDFRVAAKQTADAALTKATAAST